MSDPKQPVDPLAQTQAELPQQHAPYAGAQPNAPTYAERLAAQQAAQAPPPPPAPRRSATPWIVAAVLVTGAAAGIGFAVTKLSRSNADGNAVAGANSGGGSNGGSNGANGGGPHGASTGANGGSADVNGVGINPLLGSNGSGAYGVGINPLLGSNGSGATPAGSKRLLDVLDQRHVTLDPGAVHELQGRRIAADAFVIGVDASEVGIGPDAAAQFVAHDLDGATDVGGIASHMTLHNGAQYRSESLRAMVGGRLRTYLVTEIHSSDNGVDVIRAWMWSRPVADQVAYDASRAGTLPDPARIDDVHAERLFEAKVRAALNGRAVYIAMLANDGFSFGSAGETLEGPRVKAGFRAMTAQFKLHDGLRIVEVQPKFAYAAANVDFTNRYGTETFRVLLALYNDNGLWQIIQGHWSNGFPIPGAP